MVKLCPILYSASDIRTDFSYMICKNEYKDSLFLFNDNFKDRNSNHPGGNSAKIRPYTFYDPPRAVGIPTGWSSALGGFKGLTEDAKQAIFLSFELINLILFEYPHIKRVFYSCDKMNLRSLGFAIFKPSDDVVQYIANKISQIPIKSGKNLAVSKTALSLCENVLERKIQGKENLLRRYDYVQQFRSRKRVREF